MKLDASSPLKGIMFRRPRVILKTRQFIGLSVCLWIQEGTAWNSQVTLKHWSFRGNDKFPEGAKLCKNSFVERKVRRRLCVLLWRCCPIWAAENPSGSAVCELPDQRCTNDHLKSHKNTFLPHSEARFELHRLVLTTSTCLNASICLSASRIAVMWLARFLFVLTSIWKMCLKWLVGVRTCQAPHEPHRIAEIEKWKHAFNYSHDVTSLLWFHNWTGGIYFTHHRFSVICSIECGSLTWSCSIFFFNQQLFEHQDTMVTQLITAHHRPLFVCVSVSLSVF